MTHARIAIAEYKPGVADRMIGKVQSELLPLLRKVPGFIRYNAYRDGDRITSIARFESKAGAEQSVKVVGDWVDATAGSDLVSVQTSIAELVFDSEQIAAAPTLEERPMAH